MRIDPANTAVLVVDYQEKLLPAIHDVKHLQAYHPPKPSN